MTLPPQLTTAAEKSRIERSIAPLLRLWANGFPITANDARELASILPLNVGRKARDVEMAKRIVEHKARFRIEYLLTRKHRSSEIDQRAFDLVYPKFTTLPDGSAFTKSAAKSIALGRGSGAVNSLVRQYFAAIDS